MKEIQIPLNPVPASRPRVTRTGHTYIADPYRTFREEIAEVLKDRWSGKPIDYPVFVTVVCMAERPRTTKLSMPAPDVDNYLKAVLDGMNGIVLEDDKLVQKATVEKMWASPGEPGRIHVYIDRVE